MGKSETAQQTYFQTYEEAVRWITGLVPFGIRPGLKRMNWLMDKLNHPERSLKFIHVAGTNGKGSVCAYIAEVLRQAGFSVGTFNSPYIEQYTDRICVNGEHIAESVLLQIANQIKPLADEIAEGELGPLTMFEVTTTLALVYFARHAYPDFVVWEAGLGGRLDCTNIVYPLVSVITNIGHDHMDVLGETLAQVAAEKAGIIKSGVPVVSAASQPEAVAAIAEAARQKKSTLYLAGREFSWRTNDTKENEQSFAFACPFRSLPGVMITMNGLHQVENAAVALMTLEVLRQYYAVVVDEENIREGMRATKWKGRLEMIAQNPRILLDGAHNPEGAEALAKTLKNVYRYEKLRLMVGMVANKNHREFLRHILPLVDTLIVTEPDYHRKKPAAEFAAIVRELEPELCRESFAMSVEPDWRKALELLQAHTGERDLAVVTGTLYMVADVRACLTGKADCEKGW
ncbi:MAG TPA: folylpolyglutamate synthase/dihydrofolate synthase family protein [Bacilli bacterium]